MYKAVLMVKCAFGHAMVAVLYKLSLMPIRMPVMLTWMSCSLFFSIQRSFSTLLSMTTNT